MKKYTNFSKPKKGKNSGFPKIGFNHQNITLQDKHALLIGFYHNNNVLTTGLQAFNLQVNGKYLN